MKSKDKAAILNMGVKELAKEARDLQQRLMQVSIERRTKQIKNLRASKTDRKKLAVVLTAQRMKELSHE